MEVVELDVERVAAGGDGLAHDAEGRVVFVTGALPGERVRASIVTAKRDFARARVLEILDPSPHRIAAPCPHVAEGCGGCAWQHVAEREQRRLKSDVVADALRRAAHLEVEIDPGPELPATGYRTTLRGHAVGGRFGLRRHHTHDIVPVGSCLVAHPLVDELVREGTFPDGEVVLRAGAATGERLVVVDGPADAVEVPAGVRVVTAAQLKAGKRAWFHDEVAGRRWRVSARSFFQVRPDGAAALVDAARAAVGDRLGSGVHLVDLYAGVGLFGGVLGQGGRVTAVESSASSAADARVNLGDIDARVVRVDVGRWHPSRAGVVVADPPRTGLGRAGAAAVTSTGADRLALVSCDPAALGRDARLLAEAGWRLVWVRLVDLFPQTPHVETVSRFERDAGTAADGAAAVLVYPPWDSNPEPAD